jgi:DNA-binding CsgD family transcriptional regulator
LTGTLRDSCSVRMTRALAALVGGAGAVVAVVVQPTVGDALDLATVGLLYGDYIAAGLLILRAHPTHTIGRLMLCGGLIGSAGGGLLEVAWTRLRDHPHDSLAGLAATIGGTYLTDREAAVLALVADGRSNPEIAAELGLSLKTVQNHVSKVLAKLQVRDRTQAAFRARGL